MTTQRTMRDDEYATPDETLEQRIERRRSFRNLYPLAYPNRWVNPSDAKVVFLLAIGKCATTTVQHLMNLSNSIVAYHELPPRLWHLGQLAHDTKCEGQFWDLLIWSARRDVISTINSMGYAFGEMNHRLTFMAPAVDRIFGDNVKYLFLMRDMDESVVSGVNWGWYTPHDRNIHGRICNSKYSDAREQVAWAWCETNKFCLDFLDGIPEERKAYLPFERVASHDIDYIRGIYEKLELDVPPEEDMLHILKGKINSSDKVPVEKNWHGFDEQAAELIARSVQLEEVRI